MVLVAATCRKKWELHGAGPVRPWWFRKAGWVLTIGLLVVLAFVEEGLWDALVWQENDWLFGLWPDPPRWLTLVAVGFLAIPQVTHYLLDGLIWKMGEKDNPGLRKALLS